MKKLVCLFLCMALLVGNCCFGAVSAEGEKPDVLMLYDGEGDAGNGSENPWGVLAGPDMFYYTEGTTGYAMQSFYNGIYFFQNTFDYLGQLIDLTAYEFIEFDILSVYPIVCDLELCVCRNLYAHHGSDYEMFEVYLPAETFVHVKMPIADFVVHSTENRDKWDTLNDTKGDPETDSRHYAGYSMDRLARLRWQLTYCTYAEDGEDYYAGEDCYDMYVVFDNVVATKNGATHEHIGDYDVVDLQYWADVKPQDPEVSEESSEEESLPEPSEDSSVIEPSLPVDESEPSVPSEESEPMESEPSEESKQPEESAIESEPSLPSEEESEESADPSEPSDFSQPGEEDPTVLLGEVTGDGVVNALDALWILQAAVGKRTFTEEQKQVADLTADTVIDAADALAALKIAVGKA